MLGYIAAWAGGHYHFISLSAEVYSIDTLPFAPRPLDGVIVAAVSIGISLLATLYPSYAAAPRAACRSASLRITAKVGKKKCTIQVEKSGSPSPKTLRVGPGLVGRTGNTATR